MVTTKNIMNSISTHLISIQNLNDRIHHSIHSDRSELNKKRWRANIEEDISSYQLCIESLKEHPPMVLL
ncbi:hypothetical protein HZS_2668 [Henneguya salminicola]|nr:hypothetical protein HZS_2668 [Henneguya salminicola]